jgi:hypothetical protein
MLLEVVLQLLGRHVHAVCDLLVVQVVLLRESEHLTQVVHQALNRQLPAFLGALYHDHNVDDSRGSRNVEQHWLLRSRRSQDSHGRQGLLEVIEGVISVLGPNEVVRLLHQLVQWHGLLPKLADKLAE